MTLSAKGPTSLSVVSTQYCCSGSDAVYEVQVKWLGSRRQLCLSPSRIDPCPFSDKDEDEDEDDSALLQFVTRNKDIAPYKFSRLAVAAYRRTSCGRPLESLFFQGEDHELYECKTGSVTAIATKFSSPSFSVPRLGTALASTISSNVIYLFFQGCDDISLHGASVTQEVGRLLDGSVEHVGVVFSSASGQLQICATQVEPEATMDPEFEVVAQLAIPQAHGCFAISRVRHPPDTGAFMDKYCVSYQAKGDLSTVFTVWTGPHGDAVDQAFTTSVPGDIGIEPYSIIAYSTRNGLVFSQTLSYRVNGRSEVRLEKPAEEFARILSTSPSLRDELPTPYESAIPQAEVVATFDHKPTGPSSFKPALSLFPITKADGRFAVIHESGTVSAADPSSHESLDLKLCEVSLAHSFPKTGLDCTSSKADTEPCTASSALDTASSTDSQSSVTTKLGTTPNTSVKTLSEDGDALFYTDINSPIYSEEVNGPVIPILCASSSEHEGVKANENEPTSDNTGSEFEFSDTIPCITIPFNAQTASAALPFDARVLASRVEPVEGTPRELFSPMQKRRSIGCDTTESSNSLTLTNSENPGSFSQPPTQSGQSPPPVVELPVVSPSLSPREEDEIQDTDEDDENSWSPSSPEEEDIFFTVAERRMTRLEIDQSRDLRVRITRPRPTPSRSVPCPRVPRPRVPRPREPPSPSPHDDPNGFTARSEEAVPLTNDDVTHAAVGLSTPEETTSVASPLLSPISFTRGLIDSSPASSPTSGGLSDSPSPSTEAATDEDSSADTSEPFMDDIPPWGVSTPSGDDVPDLPSPIPGPQLFSASNVATTISPPPSSIIPTTHLMDIPVGVAQDYLFPHDSADPSPQLPVVFASSDTEDTGSASYPFTYPGSPDGHSPTQVKIGAPADEAEQTGDKDEESDSEHEESGDEDLGSVLEIDLGDKPFAQQDQVSLQTPGAYPVLPAIGPTALPTAVGFGPTHAGPFPQTLPPASLPPLAPRTFTATCGPGPGTAPTPHLPGDVEKSGPRGGVILELDEVQCLLSVLGQEEQNEIGRRLFARFQCLFGRMQASSAGDVVW
ncbi:hypothetical protein K488DRAFT_72947 [Vararia minispora EC-137]|uniref:Uncharacterized protein n=1 Tax=Vararia minispora EC-137 TaxID=1314806 RepID=A0ACB8QCL7_9AGAM|nr:hypothetical protein K488DRAFT_72947 [Vararia minispora EC-137]